MPDNQIGGERVRGAHNLSARPRNVPRVNGAVRCVETPRNIRAGGRTPRGKGLGAYRADFGKQNFGIEHKTEM